MSNKIIISIILILTFTRINHSQTESEIRGTVLFRGKPAENAVVNISSQTALAKTNSVRSDKSGGFSFKLPSGKYYITAEANIDGAKASAARELLAEPGKATVIELEMLIRLPNEIVTIAVNQNQLSDEVSKTVAAVGAEELRQRADFSLAETLRTAASLRVQQLGGFGRTASIKARGLRNQDTAILIDGVRLRDASSITGDASAFISDLTLTSVSKIEILRGPGSSLYGTNAVGATVSLVTPNPQNRPSGQISYAIGGLGLQRFRGNLSDGTSDGRFGFNIAVSRTAYTQGIDGNDEAFNTNFQGRIDYNPLRKLNLSGNIFVSDAFVKLNSNPDTVGTMPVSNSVIIEAKENVNFTPDVDDPDSQQRSKFVLGSINANFIISNSGTFTAYYSGVKTTRKNDNGPLGIGFQSAGTSIFGGDIQTAGGRLSIAAAGSGVLQLGYEFENENYLNEGKTPSGSGNFTTRASQSSNAIFAQFISSQFFKRLQLTGGFRFQDFELRTPRFSSTNSPYQGLQGLDPPHAITFDGSAVYGIEKTGTSLRFHVGNGYR
ncbi:MAG TPA: TonB-dependent receptor plug domain-containing protein, partial [Pyrinomonadaceae bacterium]|nr:TonB-dependent receptor plug domain-containing protein [Pyrinomonadaceae bacterium]